MAELYEGEQIFKLNHAFCKTVLELKVTTEAGEAFLPLENSSI